MSFENLSDEELCRLIGQRIRAARIRSGLTPFEVIGAAEVSKSTYYNYEIGVGVFSITFLNRIVRIIGCTLSELLQTDEESQRMIAAGHLRDEMMESGQLLSELKAANEHAVALTTELAAIIERSANRTVVTGRSQSWAEEIIAARLAEKMSRRKS